MDKVELRSCLKTRVFPVLVIEDDEQYSVVKPYVYYKSFSDAESVEQSGDDCCSPSASDSILTLDVGFHPTLYCQSPLATELSFQTAS